MRRCHSACSPPQIAVKGAFRHLGSRFLVLKTGAEDESIEERARFMTAAIAPPLPPTHGKRHSLRSWLYYAASFWSASYGILGLLWTLGVPGFPFGEGDTPGARHHTILQHASASTTGPWIAAIGFATALVALLMAHDRIPRWATYPAIGLGWALAATLIVVLPDHRPLMVTAYVPMLLVVIPFGWPTPLGEFMELALPWPTINLLLCVVGGAVWALATLMFQRSQRARCHSCGRKAGKDSHWTHPLAAARWGRWAAFVAIAIPLPYALTRLLWVLDIPVGIDREYLDHMWETGAVWAGLFLAAMAVGGSVLTLGLIQRWGVIWPRWVAGLAGRHIPPRLPFIAASAVSLMLASAGTTLWMVVDWGDWNEVMASPGLLWPLWSVALGAAAVAYYLRARRACIRCQDVDGRVRISA